MKLTDALQLKSMKENSNPKKDNFKPLPSTRKFSEIILYCLVSLLIGALIGYILK